MCTCNFVRLSPARHLTLFCIDYSHLQTSLVENVSTLRLNESDLFSTSHNGVGGRWLHHRTDGVAIELIGHVAARKVHYSNAHAFTEPMYTTQMFPARFIHVPWGFMYVFVCCPETERLHVASVPLRAIHQCRCSTCRMQFFGVCIENGVRGRVRYISAPSNRTQHKKDVEVQRAKWNLL